jgi:(E)-4-hydroxy-3-methylbut-2-enyl-diphosphate synthase
MKYENIINLFQYNRFKSQEVLIGELKMGGENPIRVQSMTSTNTLNTEATIEQSLRVIKAGGELVRITAQGIKEAENLENIKKGIRDAGFETPLAADIHFNPKAAFIAAENVEKVRINPGNFVDKRMDDSAVEFSDSEYALELDKIEGKLKQLLEICKENNTTLRIGVNHGSLSDRIMSRYGDTPEGMVESAMEFLRICVKNDFLNIVVSLKSSNTRVMVQANRVLVSKMAAEKMNFPLHLGVTEAGEGEDGRIKSAVGIGTLLADGIGDTIRVSLTEAPELEIPVAKKIVLYFTERFEHKEIPKIEKIPINFYEYSKRVTNQVLNIGADNLPVVIGTSEMEGDLKPEFIYLSDKLFYGNFNENYKYIVDEETWEQQDFDHSYIFPLFSSVNNFYFADKKSTSLNFISVRNNDLSVDDIQKIKSLNNIVLVLETANKNGYAAQRAAFLKLMSQNCNVPVIIKRTYKEDELEDLQLKSACDFGGLFLDGLGDGIWIDNKGTISIDDIINISFGILQASRVRVSKTEYISCPGCGRTLFDLQETTKKIREKTSHLKNLKIGIMGCIVNGPGEMADADYGYVGAGPGKITLYKNKEVIKKNIAEENAVEELIQLIKDFGDWKD